MGKWEMVRLGCVCEKKILTLPAGFTDEIVYIDISSIDNSLKEIASYQEINGKEAPSRAKQILEENDIIVSTVRPNLNAVAINTVNSKNIIVASTGYCVLRCKKTVDTMYVFQFCQSKRFISALIKVAKGASYPAVSNNDVKSTEIPLPPLAEQKRIAKNLDLASDIVKGYKEQLAELDKLVQSVFYEMFGDPVTNEKGWGSAQLSKTAQIVTGNTPPRNCKDNYGCHIEWIKTDNITDALYVTQASEYLSERGAAIGRLVGADAILMACIAGSIKSIGRVAIANRVVALNQQINAVIANKYDTLFLYWLFKMTQGYIQSTINMSLKGILSKGKLEKLVFIVPPLPLQARFASIVTEIETQKAQVQTALVQAQSLFNSLMQEYFE